METEQETTLTKEDYEYLRNNGKYSETDVVRAEAVRELQEWLKENPHIGAEPSPRNLVRYLRHSKYRMDVCKKKITNYYMVRSKVPEWFQNRDLNQKALRDFLELGPFLPLLKKDSSKTTTIIVRSAIHDPSRVSQNDLMKVYNMLYELVNHRDDSINIYGVRAVVDLRNLTLGHIMSPNKVKKMMHCMQDCYPISPKRIDFIFAPKLLDFVLDLLLRFMTPKMRTRVHVHGKDLGSLHSVVSPDILPEEYGGTAGTLQELTDHWTKEMLSAQDFFLEQEKYCSVLKDKINLKNIEID